MIYRDLHASLLRFCADTAEPWVGTQVVNFDASGEEESLPKSDLIGLMALSFEVDEHSLSGTVQVGFSPWDDTNLFRLVERVDELVEKLLPTVKLPIYDSLNLTSVPKGLVIVQNGTRVMPVVRGKVRPVQFVAFSFQSTLTFRLP